MVGPLNLLGDLLHTHLPRSGGLHVPRRILEHGQEAPPRERHGRRIGGQGSRELAEAVGEGHSGLNCSNAVALPLTKRMPVGRRVPVSVSVWLPEAPTPTMRRGGNFRRAVWINPGQSRRPDPSRCDSSVGPRFKSWRAHYCRTTTWPAQVLELGAPTTAAHFSWLCSGFCSKRSRTSRSLPIRPWRPPHLFGVTLAPLVFEPLPALAAWHTRFLA